MLSEVAVQVASLFGVLSMKDDGFKSSVRDAKNEMGSLGDRMKKVGGQVSDLGGSLVTLAAPVTAAFGVAVKSAMDFDETMTNIQAVTGKTADETKALGEELLAIGANTRDGPQAVAEAYYDIAGGVADASTHMDILNAAISTAQAGNADLGAATTALISIMNSYKFAADKASYASDVLTRTVGMGVGSMDEFAAALPQVTGLASSLSISFGDLGAMTAYLTTQGNSASQAVTQLSAMMAALLNPNETMKQALAELGYETGQAAIESLGLSGAYEALAGTQTASDEGMAKMTGSMEAMRGVTALTGEDVGGFMTTFTEGIEGATAAAEAVQMDSAAAQFDLLKSSVSAMGIEVGEALLPALNDLVAAAQPVIDKVIEWVTANPELVAQIGQIFAVATILGGGLTVLGTVISSVGTIIGVVTGAASLLSGGFGILGGVATAVAGGFGAITAAAGAMLAPVLALAAPIAAVTAAAVAAIAAVKQLIDTVSMMNEAGQWAQGEIAPKLASGEVSNQNVYDASFNAISSQFGGGVIGDVAARLFYSNVASQVGAKADGGAVSAGGMYLVGERGPELFSPGSSGTIIPNEALGGVTVNGLTIYANGAAEGRAAADGFKARLDELMVASG